MCVQRPRPKEQPQPHKLIITRQRFDEAGNRKRVHFRCIVKGCCRGLIDVAPANSANAIMTMLQREHDVEWPPNVYLPRDRRQSSSPNTRA